MLPIVDKKLEKLIRKANDEACRLKVGRFTYTTDFNLDMTLERKHDSLFVTEKKEIFWKKELHAYPFNEHDSFVRKWFPKHYYVYDIRVISACDENFENTDDVKDDDEERFSI
jgi:hypothetical protein